MQKTYGPARRRKPSHFKSVWARRWAYIALSPVLFGGSTAHAQLAPLAILSPDTQSVLNDPRKGYDATGIALGDDFLFLPSLTATGAYDDNVTRAPQKISDWYFEENPTIHFVQSRVSSYVDFYAAADNYNYARTHRLDLTDWTLGAQAKLIWSDLTVSASGYFGEAHESLASIEEIGALESPNRYYKGHLDYAVAYKPKNWGFVVGESVDRENYLSTPLIGPGILNNSDRNETEAQVYVKGLYEFHPGLIAFVKGLYDDRDFDQRIDRYGINRNSYGYRADAGLDVQLASTVDGEVFGGYLQQDFVGNSLRKVNAGAGIDFGADLSWRARPDLTVSLSAARAISDVSFPHTLATNDQSVRLGIEYGVRKDLVFVAYGSYTNSEYIGFPESDSYPGGGAKLRYFLNSKMSVDLAYDYSARKSRLAGGDFEDSTASLNLNLHV